MKLILDCREKSLYDACQDLIKTTEIFKSITIDTGNLEVGDIIIRNEDDNSDLIIIERKTVNDLLASITDGRYREQSFRLSGIDHENHNIMYLIEGPIAGANKQMVYSSMCSLNYYKGFSVIRTDNIKETAYMILNMNLKLKKENKKSYYPNTNLREEEIKYCSVVKKKKNDNVTPENFGELVLCQIPYVNSVTAVTIMKEFKTLNNLIERIKEDINCLDNMTYHTEKNQKRKISKKCIENIVTFLK
jgi:ERCC4-type nuclease